MPRRDDSLSKRIDTQGDRCHPHQVVRATARPPRHVEHWGVSATPMGPLRHSVRRTLSNKPAAYAPSPSVSIQSLNESSFCHTHCGWCHRPPPAQAPCPMPALLGPHHPWRSVHMPGGHLIHPARGIPACLNGMGPMRVYRARRTLGQGPGAAGARQGILGPMRGYRARSTLGQGPGAAGAREGMHGMLG